MSLLNDLAQWLWRLILANPILVRVVSTGGKRLRHLWVRAGYLAALFIVVLVFGQGALTAGNTSLAELAKQSTNTFVYVSITQLLMMCFIAPIFTAGAITQEKDANTLHILLTTPLSNSQIVFGSLLSRLYFVWVLLLSGLPIFCITMLFGGVTLREVIDSFLLSATTALLTGSLAISIAVIRVGTRRTILWFFVGVAAYLLAFGYAGRSGATAVPEAPLGGSGYQMSWLAPFHPLLALLVATGQTPAPDPSRLGAYSWPWSWMLASPQYAYIAITSLLSLVLVVASVGFLRKSAKEGEVTFLSRFTAAFTRKAPNGERRRKPRTVWSNPIAWREAATRASAGGRSLLLWVFVGCGLAAGVVLLVAYENAWWGLGPQNISGSRGWLTVLMLANLFTLLLFVCSAGASSLTREKESQSIELLMSTPLTSRDIVWGTLRGLMSFSFPLVAGPTAALLLFAVADLFRAGPTRPALTTPEAVVLLPALFVAFASVIALLSLNLSLNSKTTARALMFSVGVSGIGAALLFGCGSAALQASPLVCAALGELSPIHGIQNIVDFESAFRLQSSSSPPGSSDLNAVRGTRVFGTIVAVAAYCVVAYTQYNAMVRNYDRTLRVQSA